MKQEEILKKLSGEERLNQAFLLSDFVRELSIRNIKDTTRGKITKKLIIKKLRQRLENIDYGSKRHLSPFFKAT